MTTQVPIPIDSIEDLQASLWLNDQLSPSQNANNPDATDNSPPLLREVLVVFCRDLFMILLTAYYYGLNSFHFWIFGIILWIPLAITLLSNKNWKQRLWKEAANAFRS